ncbi:hypothetical protein CPG37_04570 [Malaciobacter canalis]|uniref:DUF3168 domain-containing protein n=1 Tax=Malaciobacter canalis TaxID=1912871 RepID=A0ABX4LVR7_9BACT|nr:hypothetical protein [Malaciobacter canalis]PHO10326.1 hypothetical protein CPG37_04570 [Malaciobacter canalis]QEE32431.1 hypothetical protein ACAN_0942 [Malaciobacter canalis]
MIRQKIVDTIIEKLKTISGSNGFYSEAGANVFEWLEKPLDKDEYPAIVVRDPADNVTDDFTITSHTLKIEVDIAVSGKNTPWNMREVTSDVIKAFSLVEEELNYQCKCNGSEFITEQKDTTYGGVRVEFDVMYQSRRWEQ